RANALLALDGSLGHVTEVLSGDSYQSLSTSSPHQIWSAAMVVSPLLRGLFGLQTEVAAGTLTFAPHVPAEWTSFAIRNVPVGSAKLDLHYAKDIDGKSVRQSSTCTTPKTSTASRWKSELRRELLARFPSTSSPPSACVPKSSASRSTVAEQSFMSRRVASTSMSSCSFPCPPDHTRCASASKTILDSPTIPPCPFSEPVPRACGSCPRLGHPPAIASRSACPASRGASTASPPGTPHRLSSSPVPSSQKGPLGELILSWSFRRTEPSSSPIGRFPFNSPPSPRSTNPGATRRKILRDHQNNPGCNSMARASDAPRTFRSVGSWQFADSPA